MSSLYNTHYKHWEGKHQSIWHRRKTIAVNGLRGVLGGKVMRYVVLISWVVALAMAAILFLIGQLMVKDSVVFQWFSFLGTNVAQNQNSALYAFITWLENHPEISVKTSYNLLFYRYTTLLSPAAMLTVALAIPYLISRDLSSQAIVIYSSKAVGKFDYLLGKFATIFGLLTLTWLAPVVASWFLGNMLAPDWHFFWHSRGALYNSVFYIVTNMVCLSLLGLGVSAISGKEKTTVGLWIGLWILGVAFVGTAQSTKDWLKFFSFKFDLDQIAVKTFNLKEDLRLASENVPLMKQMAANMNQRFGEDWQVAEMGGALIGLSIMTLAAVVVLLKRVRTD